MSGIPSLIRIADLYGAAHGVPESTVSKRALNDTSRLSELRTGQHDIGVRRLERTMQWFSENWPANAVWPADIPRPESQNSAGGGETVAA